MKNNKLISKLKLKSRRTTKNTPSSSLDSLRIRIKKHKLKSTIKYAYSFLKKDQIKVVKRMIRQKVSSETIKKKINNFKRANKISRIKKQLKKPGTLINLYKQIQIEAKNYHAKSKISQRYIDLLKKYTSALNANIKSEKIKERNKGILKAKLDRFRNYKKIGKKLNKSQVFPSYFVNKTQKIFDYLAYLSIYYPNEIMEMKNNGMSESQIVYKLKRKAMLDGHLVPLKQGSQFGYIDIDLGQVWSGD